MNLRYAKVIDENGRVEIAVGTNIEYYKSIGMQLLDVELSDVDNAWYLAEKCPHKSEDEKTQERKENFESQFLLTSKGNYRLQPKGYANAQQSIDTINNIVNASGGLTEQIANMIIFYDTPDFTKSEECTEEWLVQHQHHPEPMTIQQWVEFYIEFTTLYAQKQYKAGLTL